MSAGEAVFRFLKRLEVNANRKAAAKAGVVRRPLMWKGLRAHRPLRIVIARAFWLAPSGRGPGEFDVYHRPYPGRATMVKLDSENPGEEAIRQEVVAEYNRKLAERPERKTLLQTLRTAFGG